MKKQIAIFLVLCLFLSAAGCSNKPTANTEPTVVTETIPIENNSLIVEETQITEETSLSMPDGPLPIFQKDATLETTVLYDENNLKITATELIYNNYSVELELLVENNSDKAMKFICESLGYSCNSVNDYMIEDGYMNCTVDPGKKAHDSISFDIQELMLHGIYEITEIEVGFDISDEDHNDIYTGPLHMQTSAFENSKNEGTHYLDTLTNPSFMSKMEMKVLYTSKDALYNENGIRILSACLLQNEGGEQMLLLEAENSTDAMIHLSTFDISLNGLCVEPYRHSSLTMNPGKRGFLAISLDSVMEATFRESFGIEKVGTLGFRLEVSDLKWDIMTESQEITVAMYQEDFSFDTTGTEVFNQDGLTIVSKGIVEDSSEYSKNQHILLLAMNDSDHSVEIDDVYDSVSVNGFMVDYYFHGQTLAPGKSGIIRIEVTDSSLEENKVENISEVEVRLDIDSNSEITLNMTY